MSAPDTNVEKQGKHHWPSLLGIAIAVIFGTIMGVAITVYALKSDGDSGATAYQGTGETTGDATLPPEGQEGVTAPAQDGEGVATSD